MCLHIAGGRTTTLSDAVCSSHLKRCVSTRLSAVCESGTETTQNHAESELGKSVRKQGYPQYSLAKLFLLGGRPAIMCPRLFLAIPPSWGISTSVHFSSPLCSGTHVHQHTVTALHCHVTLKGGSLVPMLPLHARGQKIR